MTITEPAPLPVYLAARSAPDALEVDQEAALAGAVAQLEAWAQGTDRADETALERIERLLGDDPDEEADRALLTGVSAQISSLAQEDWFTTTDPDEEQALVVATAERLRDALRAAWRVENDGQARWAVTRLREVRAHIEAHQANAAAWRAEIDTWEADVLAPLRRREAFFHGSLTDYMRRLREADPKHKSHKLPGGTVLTSTAHAAAVVIPDDETSEAQVIAWAREHLKGEELDGVVKVVEEVRVSKLRGHVKVADEVIGQHLVIELDCGHTTTVPAPDDLDDESMEEAQPIDRWPCEECVPVGPDSLASPSRAVVSVERRPVTVKVARSVDTGQPVPGATVRPASITYDVKLS